MESKIRNLLSQDIRALAVLVCLGTLLVFLLGPFVLLVYPLQRWASKQIWDAQDRWETLWCFAIVGCLAYLPLIMLHTQFVHAWQKLAFLGPATFGALWFRSFLMLFLVPTATLLLERIHPRTSSTLIRVKRSGDVMLQQKVPKEVLVSAPLVVHQKKTSQQQKTVPPPGMILHRPKAKSVRQCDPQPPGEVFYEEKQRRQAKPASIVQGPLPQPVPKKINWDEGEGTYRDK